MQLLKDLLFTGIKSRIFIHRYHPAWVDKYNYSLSIEDKHTTGSLLLQQYTESLIHNSDPLKFIPCEIYLKSNPFSNTTIIPYEIELPPAGKKWF